MAGHNLGNHGLLTADNDGDPGGGISWNTHLGLVLRTGTQTPANVSASLRNHLLFRCKRNDTGLEP